jgi:hypothetical protein
MYALLLLRHIAVNVLPTKLVSPTFDVVAATGNHLQKNREILAW